MLAAIPTRRQYSQRAQTNLSAQISAGRMGGHFPLGAASDVLLHILSFDESSDMVIGATVNLLLTGPSQAPWSVGHCKLGSIVLQFGVEGGSKILHGVSRRDALSFVFQDE